MKTRENGFILITALMVLMVLTLIVIAVFEQAQWMKRGVEQGWLQTQMEDLAWQQLALIESEWLEKNKEQDCFQNFSTANDYFFLSAQQWREIPFAACAKTIAEIQIERVYEKIEQLPCAKITDSNDSSEQNSIGVDFFRVTLHLDSLYAKQQLSLQAIEAVPAARLGLNASQNCQELKIYHQGRQSWRMG